MSNMKQKVSCNMKLGVDKISDLQDDVIDNILSRLSLRDVVGMSILSSKWRYKWATLPNLVFDNQSLLVYTTQEPTVVKNNLVNIIQHVLLLHTGPIYKFKLSHTEIQAQDIDGWILHLSRGPIKEFILEMWNGPRYKLPSSIYSCRELIHLELFQCVLKPPVTFSGFRSLKSLDLRHVTMEQSAFERMISSCPLLKRLTLTNLDGFTLLNIHAPNLHFFDVWGVYEDVSFRDTFRLASISMSLDKRSEQYIVVSNSGNLIKFFACLPRIQRLKIQSIFLKYLASGTIPGKLPTPCADLRYLSIHINFNDTEENLAALCLLRSFPNLRELEILARVEEHATAWEAANNHIVENLESFPFNQLRVVKIVGISGIIRELNLIAFILDNSPILERMSIEPASVDGECNKLMKELLTELFRPASPHAEILYLGLDP